MQLVGLEVRDWRNLAHARLETAARFVVLHGENAQGKTNLLEAVWLLATLRSFRERRAERLIRQGAGSLSLKADVVGEGGLRRLGLERSAESRSLQLDGRAPQAAADWFAVLRAVLFCPDDAALVRGEPGVRRAFVDRAAFTAWPAHLELVRDYRRVLAQKSALLRAPRVDRAQLGTWNAQLVGLGARLMVQRQRVLDELAPHVDALHAAIAGGGKVGLHVAGLGRGARDEAAAAGKLEERLAAAADEELRRGMALEGPHRDDLDLQLDGRPARAYASQGQARSLVLALKLAELHAARRRGEAPLFLLDDLTSELDRGRMGRLIDVLAELDNQVWVTTTDPRWLGPLPAQSTALVRVVDGTIAAGPPLDGGPFSG
jgi:DNA replication and repair protein RecF